MPKQKKTLFCTWNVGHLKWEFILPPVASQYSKMFEAMVEHASATSTLLNVLCVTLKNLRGVSTRCQNIAQSMNDSCRFTHSTVANKQTHTHTHTHIHKTYALRITKQVFFVTNGIFFYLGNQKCEHCQ